MGSSAGAPDHGSTSEIPLSTAWPMLRLAPDALDRIRSSAPVPIAEAAPAAPAAPPAAAATDAAPVTVASGPTDETAAVVERHFRTMERFLDAGEQVMKAYLTGAAPVAVEARAGRWWARSSRGTRASSSWRAGCSTPPRTATCSTTRWGRKSPRRIRRCTRPRSCRSR